MAKSKTVIVTYIDGRKATYSSISTAAHELHLKASTITLHAEQGTSHKGMWFKVEENGKTMEEHQNSANNLAFVQNALPMLSVAHPKILEQMAQLIKPVVAVDVA